MTPLIRVQNLKKHYQIGKKTLKAVDDVSFAIYPNETLGLVGESGCGKTTLGRAIIQLFPPTSGSIYYLEKDITKQKLLKKEMQYIFQDPFASLNPRMTAGKIIEEPLVIHANMNKKERLERVCNLLYQVGLSGEHYTRYPHEFSGGQRQRIGIARALALNPSFIVCDEPIASLDVSIQAQIVNLLKGLQERHGLTYLFISHDLAMVNNISDRVAVMYKGKIVELAETYELYSNPLHPYTKALLAANPIPDPEKEKNRVRMLLKEDPSTSHFLSNGCYFRQNCKKAHSDCASSPKLREVSPGHYVSCHLQKEVNTCCGS